MSISLTVLLSHGEKPESELFLKKRELYFNRLLQTIGTRKRKRLKKNKSPKTKIVRLIADGYMAAPNDT